MEIDALIRVQSPSVAGCVVLGLSVIERTVKALVEAGCRSVVISSPENFFFRTIPSGANKKISFTEGLPQDFNERIRLSGEFHYDPDFVRWMVKTRTLRPHEKLDKVSSLWWENLDCGNESKKSAEKKLLENIRMKTKGWVAPLVNKPVSFAITRLLVRTNITPNQITFLNLVLAVFSAWLIMHTDYALRLAGAGLMYFVSIFDGCDGEIARLKLCSSKAGAWFDTIADDIANNLFFAGLFAGIFYSTGNPLYWQTGLLSLVFSFVATAVIYHQLATDTKGGNVGDFQPAWQSRGPEGEGCKKSWFDHVRPIMKRDFFIAVLFVFIVVDLREIVFWIAVTATAVTFSLYVFSFLLARRKAVP